MPRELKTAEEIQAEVSRLVHESRTVKDDLATVQVPLPMRLVGCGADDCNWTMETFGNAVGYVDVVLHAKETVQAKWNLAD